MIQQTTAPTRINDNCIRGDVLGHSKPIVTARPAGLEVYFKAAMGLIELPYDQLMQLPAFRSGLLAVLKAEIAQNEPAE